MPTSLELTTRLDSDLRAAGKAIDGISGVVSPYDAATVRVSPSSQQATCQAIINSFDGSQAAQDAWIESQTQSSAVGFMTISTDNAKAYRATAAIMVDEINTLRQWITAFKAQVALASTLADLKTRVAGLPAVPDRTMAQAKTAFIAKINAGT